MILRGLVHKFFHLTLLGKVGKKKMFGDILDRNKAFLDY